MADLVPISKIQKYIPDITHYRVKAARHHKLEYGRGAPVPDSRSSRMRVSTVQLDHFLTFITSPHVVQDLPFGNGTFLYPMRQELQGLDYIAAEGATAFDDLLSVLEKLIDHGLDHHTVQRLQLALKEGKQYLKTDYKVHVMQASTTADHCLSFALSDSKDKSLTQKCDHPHNQFCQCLNNFRYPDDAYGVSFWRSYDIGEGKTLPWRKLP
ncbi:Hypothetical predicted protein, partial [Paramuricea clavata]